MGSVDIRTISTSSTGISIRTSGTIAGACSAYFTDRVNVKAVIASEDTESSVQGKSVSSNIVRDRNAGVVDIIDG